MNIIETENIFNNSLLKLLLRLQAKEEFQYTSAADRQTVEKVQKEIQMQPIFLKHLLTTPSSSSQET